MIQQDIITYHRIGGGRGPSYYGVEQKAIGCKLDLATLHKVEAEQSVSGIKKNALINMALEWYLDELDEERSRVAHGSADSSIYSNQATAQMFAGYKEGNTLDSFLIKHMTCGEIDELSHISRQMGATLESITEKALQHFIEDYKKRPFAWL